MELKEYQQRVLDDLAVYLSCLRESEREAKDYFEFQKSKGKEASLKNYVETTWNQLNEKRLLPFYRDNKGQKHIASHISRWDGLNRPIPNICLKVPTGGGKTLLAAASVEKINTEYFEQQNGFILWVIPTDSIYKQTWKHLSNREHPYRQMLERASGGRVKLLEKMDRFTLQDVQEHLCVMVLMLQSSARASKETLKIFRDSGGYQSFFPEVDDYHANNDLLNTVPNLSRYDLTDVKGILANVSVKQSLDNVLKLIRPIIIIDEGHKAYSETARNTLCEFNPRFILELSATPNPKKHLSNVLVDVCGSDLKKEQMIKLPINIINYSNADWKLTLTKAVEEHEGIVKKAIKLQKKDGTYIRPILLIRVDRTGKDMRDGKHLHADDAKEYLIDRIGIKEAAIRIKSAAVDEIGDEDLLSPFCPVKFIITKSALQEGWDCPFAYSLAILSKMTAATALTQMIGRILRQPFGKATSLDALNECYIFCFEQDVAEAVTSIRKGLENEGMGDLKDQLRCSDSGIESLLIKRKIRRRSKFKNLKVMLPKVNIKDQNGFRELNYERDILGYIDWGSLEYSKKGSYQWDVKAQIKETRVKLDERMKNQYTLDYEGIKQSLVEESGGLDFAFLVRQLMEVIPNPWQAGRILDDAIQAQRKKGVDDLTILKNRIHFLESVKLDLKSQLDELSEKLFRSKLAKGDIQFHLVSSNDDRLNWDLADILEVSVTESEQILRQKNGSDLQRSLFENVYSNDLNPLEKDVAWYLDDHTAIKWWHRLIAKQDYYVQGWQRNKIYPDFLACVHENGDGSLKLAILETKGEHLAGNKDTEYKRKVFKILASAYNQEGPVGKLEVESEKFKVTSFDILLQESWREDVHGILGKPKAV